MFMLQVGSVIAWGWGVIGPPPGWTTYVGGALMLTATCAVTVSET